MTVLEMRHNWTQTLHSLERTNIGNKHFLSRESCLFINWIKSTFELVQEGFRHPIISRYLTHSCVTEILILDSGQ